MDRKMLLVERQEAVCTLTLNCPERRNTLSPELLLSLAEALTSLAKDPGVRALVLRGAGREAFSAGYEIGRIGEGVEEVPEGFEGPFDYALHCLHEFPYPTIAMVYGYAVGGGLELAVTCDLRLAARDARLGITPAKLGVVYSPKGIHRFLQLVGPAVTRYLFFTGRLIDARTAHAWGLVDQVFPPEELEEAAYALAREVSQNAPLSLKGTKRAIRLLTAYRGLPPAEEAELRSLREQALRSEDLKEGQRAFSQRRSPHFTGR